MAGCGGIGYGRSTAMLAYRQCVFDKDNLYMDVSSAKRLTLDLTWSGRSFWYARKSMSKD